MDADLPATRRTRLLEFVQNEGHATVTALATQFNVSQDTVRRDIEHLAGLGLVNKAHGGVVAKARSGRTSPVAWRASENQDAKRDIGRAAAALVADGETLFLGGGTTVLEVARELHTQRHLTIVTNNLLVPAVFDSEVADEVWIIGGQLREGAMSTYGALQLPGVTRLSADRAFVGVSGISIEGGLSVAAAADAAIVRAMLERARIPVLVADHSKFGRDAFASVGTFADIRVLVTDAPVPVEIAATLAGADVKTLVTSAG